MNQDPSRSPLPPVPSAYEVSPEPPAYPPVVPYGHAGSYAPLNYASASYLPYESARPRARVVIALSWVAIVCQLILIWPQLNDLRELQGIVRGDEPSDEISTSTWVQVGVGLVYLLVIIVCVVYWLMWVHRTYRNLRPLGADGLNYSPGWAVGYYFIPIMNLFRPFQVMRETWQASSPEHRGGTDWVRIAVPALIGWWWAIHLFSAIVNQISLRVGMRSEDPSVLLSMAWVDFAMLGVDSVLLFIEIKLVQKLTDLQDERAGAFGTMLPVPVAAYAGGYSAQ
jgi:hypothetical protein